MDHQAIEWSLAGRDGHPSLLKENPGIFLSVALDLAEALWVQKRNNPDRLDLSISALLNNIPSELEKSWQLQLFGRIKDCVVRVLRRIFLALIPRGVIEDELSDPNTKSDALVDDAPSWHYQRILPSQDPHERCLDAVRDCFDHIIKESPADFVPLARIIRESHMASAHMLLFDVLLEHKQEPLFADALRESVIDFRLLRIYGFECFIEEGLAEVWPRLAENDRLYVFEQLRELLKNEETKEEGMHLLARLDLDSLPDDLQRSRPGDDDLRYEPRSRPSNGSFDLDSDWAPVQSESDFEPNIGLWPANFETDLLKALATANQMLSKSDLSPEILKKNVDVAFETAKKLLPVLRTHADLLDDSSRFWIWRALREMLLCFRKTEGTTPDADVIVGCAELALGRIETLPVALPGSLPERDVWTGHRESPWEHALRLADEALTWPPVNDDAAYRLRFEETLISAYEGGDPLVQLICTITIRPWH
jgi:hypothetical protein